MIIVVLLLIPLLMTVCSFLSVLIKWVVLKLTDDSETIKGIIKDIFRDEFDDDSIRWTNGISFYIFSPFILVLLIVALIVTLISLPLKFLSKKMFDL